MKKINVFLAFFFFATAWASPPPVPSAGIIERELEKEYEIAPISPEKEAPSIEIDIPEEKLELPDGVCIQVDTVRVIGNQAIGSEEIEGWIRGWEGKRVCLREIYEMCSEINREYALRGYFLARAYPPPQTVENGVLTLQVLEGYLGEVRVEGNEYYSERFISSYFERLQGKALKYGAFLRAILLLNDLGDLQAAAVLTKGKEVGTADVVIKVQDKRPIHLYLNGNNYGKDLTTNFRVGGRLDANVFTYGDRFSLAEVVGFPVNALYFTDAVYRVPLNRNGAFLELAYLFSKFKVEEMLSLRLKGRSDIGTIKGIYAVHRSRDMSVDCFGSFDVKQIQNFVLGQLTSFDKLRVATFGYIVDRFATRTERNYLNARFAVGIPNLFGGLSAVSSECSRVGAGGLFVKFNADYDRFQTFRKDCYLMLHASGQWSPFKLAVPEQVYIGGIDTVRGFPLAVALGDSGYYGNVEFRFPPPLLANQRFFVAKKKWREVFQVALFLDQGGTFFYGGSNTFLWGTGVGLRLNGTKAMGSLSLSIDVGWPLNHPSLSDGAFTYIKVTGQPF